MRVHLRQSGLLLQYSIYYNLQPSSSQCTLSGSHFRFLNGSKSLIFHGHCTSVPEIALKNH